MSKENLNTPSKMIVLDGVTYQEDNLDTPYTGVFNWTTDDDAEITSVYENGHCVSRLTVEEGVKKSRTTFKGGKSKEVIIYDENGLIRIKNQLEDGKLDGKTEFFSDGKLLITTEFKNGKRNGESIVYNSDGSVADREYYINDVKQNQT